jgi:MFS family permease
VALACQLPGGALVDIVRSKRLLALGAVTAVSASALSLALWPSFTVVIAGRVLQGAASSVLGPVIAALSLGLVGHAALGERLGRNARFASLGGGIGAAAMGATAYLFSNRAVFVLAALLVIPALIALLRIRPDAATRHVATAEAHRRHGDRSGEGLRELLSDRRLLIFGGCVVVFHLANAAMLPAMAGLLTPHCGRWAATVVAACMVVPTFVVAGFSPWVGRKSEAWGRRPLLLVSFAALLVRGVLFALVKDPTVVIAVQVLDGVSAAVLGVMFPLIVADITRTSGHFNLALGLVGTAMGIGASLSTLGAGRLTDHFGCDFTFFALAAIAGAGLAMVWSTMPETRPVEKAA